MSEREAAIKELARRELMRRQQAAQLEQPSPLQPAPQPVEDNSTRAALMQSIPDPVRAVVSGLMEGTQQIPHALSQFVQPVLGPAFAGAGGMAMPSGASGTTSVQDLQRPEFEFDKWGKDITVPEQVARAQYPLTSEIAKVTPAIAATWPAGGAAKGIPLAGRLGQAGLESMAAGALIPSQEDTLESRMGQSATDFGLGVLFRGGFEGIKKATSPLAKYNPFKTKGGAELNAARTLQKWHGMPSEKLDSIIAMEKARLGDNFEVIGLPGLVGEPNSTAMRNIQSEYAKFAGPDAGRAILDRQAKRAEVLDDLVGGLKNTLKLSDDESKVVKEVYSKLDEIPVDPDRYIDLLNDPNHGQLLSDLMADPYTSKALSNLNPRGVAYWEEVKKAVDKMRFSDTGPKDLPYHKEQALKTFSQKIKNATQVAESSGVALETARRLSQRKIVAENIDEIFQTAKQSKRGPGEYGVDPGAVLQLANGRKWHKLEKSLSAMKEGEEKQAALYNMRLVRDLAFEVRDAAAYKQVGKSEKAQAELGGLFSTVGRQLADIAGSKYNMAIIELLDNPVAHAKALKQVEKMDQQTRRMYIVNYLTQIKNQMENQE